MPVECFEVNFCYWTHLQYIKNEIFAKGTKNAFQYPTTINFHNNKTEIIVSYSNKGQMWRGM